MDANQVLPHPKGSGAEPRLGLGPLGIAVRAFVAIAILIGANVLVAGVFALLTAVLGIHDRPSSGSLTEFFLRVPSHVCTLALVVCAVWAWMRFVERRDLRDAGWRWTRASPGWLLLSVVIAGGLVVAAIAVLPATGPVAADPGSSAPPLFGLIALLTQAFLLQAVPEELLFRGWLFNTMRARPILAIAVTTSSFTAIHLISSGGQDSFAERLIYLAVPFGFSLLAAGMRLWTGSLWSAVGVHGGFHVGNATAMALLPQVELVSTWIVVGALDTAVGTVLIITALIRARNRS